MTQEITKDLQLKALTETESGKELIKQTAFLLIRKSDEWCDDESYSHACLLIGRSECIKYKLEQGLDLSDKDKAYIIEML